MRKTQDAGNSYDMIELRAYSTLSCGSMPPAHAARLGKLAGLRVMALTERVDLASMPSVLEHLVPTVRSLSLYAGIDIIAGCELAYLPPALLPGAIQQARSHGAKIVTVLGQYVGSHVEEGTNLAAIEAGCDILCSPGLLTETEALLAAERNVMLDITAHGPHALANGHVARMARVANAPVVVTGGIHAPTDFISTDLRRAVALGAGMSLKEYATACTQLNARASSMLLC